MKADDIARIAAWLAATDIERLELRGPGTALQMRQTAGGVSTEELPDEAGADAAGDVTVTAPAVGVLLLRHPLRSDDLAPPGTAVAAGQVLALLQTGPLLRPVAAPAAGVVQQTLVPQGDAVGYGTPLFVLSTSG